MSLTTLLMPIFTVSGCWALAAAARHAANKRAPAAAHRSMIFMLIPIAPSIFFGARSALDNLRQGAPRILLKGLFEIDRFLPPDVNALEDHRLRLDRLGGIDAHFGADAAVRHGSSLEPCAP